MQTVNLDQCRAATDDGEFTSGRMCPTQTGAATGALIFHFASTLLTRIEQQRRTARDLLASGTGNASNGIALGGAASADSVSGVASYGRLSPFFITDYSHVDRDQTAHGLGYKENAESGILGADYRISRSLFAGGTFNYINGKTDFDNSRGSVDLDAYLFALHASKYWDNNVFLDTLISYGFFNADIDRNGAFGGRYNASADGDVTFGEIAVGHVSNAGGLRLTPKAKLFLLDGSLDGYSEKGGGGAQTISGQDFDSVNVELSLQADYAILTGFGVILPSINVAYRHEYTGTDVVTSRIPGVVQFNGQPDQPDPNVLITRLGVSMQFTHGWSAYLSYEHLFEHRYRTRDDAVLGIRYEIF